jgi:hypothetical protein
MTRLSPYASFAGALLLLAWGARAATLDKIVAFPTADQVVIHATFSADKPIKGVKITGEIVPIPEGPAIWKGELGSANVTATATSQYTIKNLKPNLWTPIRPTLYQLKITATYEGKDIGSKSARIGFRSFEARDGNFFLNGKPIFLRGIAINPPGRTIPEKVGESRQFAYDYVKFLRSQNVNIIRLDHDSNPWFDVCDELGMMLYQGVYHAPPRGGETKDMEAAADDAENDPETVGVPLNKQSAARKGSSKDFPPVNFNKSMDAYKEIFSNYANHPSVVIYVLSNELPYNGDRGDAWHEFLTKAHTTLKKWDPSRPFIGNAGYGLGREGDVNDVHRYWGWYYNSFLTFYNLRDAKLLGDYQKNQPLTFSECVGSFTGPNGAYNLIEKKQLGASLGWCGLAEDQAGLATRHQCRQIQEICESFRRLRPINPRISGLMPFTILFDNWSGITGFDQMRPKAAMTQMAKSYQPILLSWENWTSQVYSGTTIEPLLHVVNDSDDFGDIDGKQVSIELQTPEGKTIPLQQHAVPHIPYYQAKSKRIPIELPRDLTTGSYKLIARGWEKKIENETTLFIAGSDWKQGQVQLDKPVALFDPSRRTGDAMKRLDIPFVGITDLKEVDPAKQTLVIGEDSVTESFGDHAKIIGDFVRGGGRVVWLAQNAEKMKGDWLPAKIEFFSATANSPHYPAPARPTRDQTELNVQFPDHPVVQGLGRERLAYWSDYGKWDAGKPGFPAIYPVSRGFKLTDERDLAHVANLISYDRGLEGIALAELFDGSGSILLSGMDLVKHCGLDPAADRLMVNLIQYAASNHKHPVHPTVSRPIRWADYPTQQGVLAGPIQGLLIDVEWTPPPTNPKARPLTREQGSWNSKPSDQFIPQGIRAIGPFGYSTGSVPRDLDRASKNGSGFFWAGLPAGRKAVVTKIKNPTAAEGSFTVDAGAGPATIKLEAHKEGSLRAPLPPGASDVRVQYSGNKDLVILETNFE